MYKIIETNGKVRSGKISLHDAIEVYAELVACGVACKLIGQNEQEVSEKTIGIATRFLLSQLNSRIEYLENLREIYKVE